MPTIASLTLWYFGSPAFPFQTLCLADHLATSGQNGDLHDLASHSSTIRGACLTSLTVGGLSTVSTRARLGTMSSGCTSWQASRALRNRQVPPDSFSASAPESSPRHLYAEPRRSREALGIRPRRCQQSDRQASASPERSPRESNPFTASAGRGTSGSRQWSYSRTNPSKSAHLPRSL